jgi:tetratricopeptide (TPR) repeat protein
VILRRLCLAALAAALLGRPAPAQTTEIQKEVEADLRDARKQQQAEDIEVMRRLLHGALQESYGLAGVVHDAQLMRRMWLDVLGTLPAPKGRDDHFLPAPEGVYLKGTGIVYTVTLPAPLHDSMVEGAGAKPKAPTAWERARAEVRGEKPDRAKAPPPPPLADAILRVLWENGRHLSGLADAERVVVVITFRGPGAAAACAVCHAEPFKDTWGHLPGAAAHGGAYDKWVTSVLAADPTARALGLAREAAVQQQPTPQQHDAQSAQALGDLHFRQGKFADAVTAYTRALDLLRQRLVELVQKQKGATPEKVQALLTAAEVSNRLAQAHLALKDTESARKAAEAAAGWTREAERVSAALGKPPQAAAPALPAKLIVSVGKKALHADSSFEDFRKAATIETVTPEEK